MTVYGNLGILSGDYLLGDSREFASTVVIALFNEESAWPGIQFEYNKFLAESNPTALSNQKGGRGIGCSLFFLLLTAY